MGDIVRFRSKEQKDQEAQSKRRASINDVFQEHLKQVRSTANKLARLPVAERQQLAPEVATNDVSLVKRETIKEIYSAVSGLARKRHVALRRGSVAEATDDQLVHWINSSSHFMWKQHPSFYLAVVQEAKKRWRYLR